MVSEMNCHGPLLLVGGYPVKKLYPSSSSILVNSSLVPQPLVWVKFPFVSSPFFDIASLLFQAFVAPLWMFVVPVEDE